MQWFGMEMVPAGIRVIGEMDRKEIQKITLAGHDSLGVAGRGEAGVQDDLQPPSLVNTAERVQDKDWPTLDHCLSPRQDQALWFVKPHYSPGVGEKVPEGKGILLPGQKEWRNWPTDPSLGYHGLLQRSLGRASLWPP